MRTRARSARAALLADAAAASCFCNITSGSQAEVANKGPPNPVQTREDTSHRSYRTKGANKGPPGPVQTREGTSHRSFGTTNLTRERFTQNPKVE